MLKVTQKTPNSLHGIRNYESLKYSKTITDDTMPLKLYNRSKVKKNLFRNMLRRAHETRVIKIHKKETHFQIAYQKKSQHAAERSKHFDVNVTTDHNAFAKSTLEINSELAQITPHKREKKIGRQKIFKSRRSR